MFTIDKVDDKSFRVNVQVSLTFYGRCLTSCNKIQITVPAVMVAGVQEYADGIF
jgi:hypothetical protein